MTEKMALQAPFEEILAHYARASSRDPFGKSSPLWGEFERLSALLAELPDVRAFDNITISWSVGKGRWATVPWIAALDTRETTQTSEGVYVIYLFRADLSGVYLTLNQGTHGTTAPIIRRHHLRARAEALRSRCGLLEETGFSVSEGIDLRSGRRIIRGYEDSTIAYKLYARGSVPSDSALVSDLVSVLSAYQKLVPSRRFLGKYA
jgi:hypothetical protein